MAAEDPSYPQVGHKQHPKWNANSTRHLSGHLRPGILTKILLIICLLKQVQSLDLEDFQPDRPEKGNLEPEFLEPENSEAEFLEPENSEPEFLELENLQGPSVTGGRAKTPTVNCSERTAKALLEGLDKVLPSKEIRPITDLRSPTKVTTQFILYGILGVDEKAQLLTTFIWHILVWQIEGVIWEPEQCGADRISLPREKLWVPDILINEFMDSDRSPTAPYVYLDAGGNVIDGRPVRVVSSCNLDIYTFPFDVQNCSLTFNSFMLRGGDVQLSQADSAEETLRSSKEVLKTVGEWELIDIMSVDTFDSTSYDFFDEVVYHIVLKRRPTTYVVNLMVPSSFLITVDLFSFLLPPQSVDRSAFKMTLILGYTVFLLIMNDLLPITGNRIPLINVFFSLSLSLMVGSLLETVLVTNMLCNSTRYPPAPRWIRVLFLQYLSRLVCLHRKPSDPAPEAVTAEVKSSPDVIAEPQSDEPVLGQLKMLNQDVQAIRQQVEKHVSGDQISEEWIQIGNVIDRLLFGIYIIFFIACFIAIGSVWVQWYNL